MTEAEPPAEKERSGIAGYWKTVALVFSGTALAQAIPLLGSLFIARLFIPSEFGVFTAWLGLAAIAGIFVTARLEMALALEDDGLPRRRLAVAVLITTATLLLTLSAVYGIARIWVQAPVDMPGNLETLLVPAVAALALAQIMQAWAAAEGTFHLLTTMRVVQALLITGLQIMAGFLAPNAYNLALSHVVGVAAAAAMGFVWLRPNLGGRTISSAIFELFLRYFRFPLFSLPADTLNTAATQLPLILVTSRFGAEIGGYLALGMRTLGAPISLLGTAVLDVFKRRASESWRASGSARLIYRQTFVVLAAGSVVATLCFMLFGEALFVVAFGETWREAGRIAVWMLPMFALRFVASPLSYMFYVAQKQHEDLIWQIALFIVTVVALSVFSAYQTTLQVYAWGYGALYVVYIGMSYRVSLGAARDRRN